jgi:hypothetical protein
MNWKRMGRRSLVVIKSFVHVVPAPHGALIRFIGLNNCFCNDSRYGESESGSGVLGLSDKDPDLQ